MERLILEESRGVMLGCSGGLDSTALLGLFCEIRNAKKNFELRAFHVNYGLRGADSEADEAHISALCAALGVELDVHRISPTERNGRKGEGIQEWARRLRRSIAADYAAAGYIIALAHHRDDLAENVLLRLARGVSPTRVGGLKTWDPPYWRPLLGERKAELAAYLNRRGMTHRDDASNAKLDYNRNVIRHRILPELEQIFPGATERIAAFANDAEDLGLWCDPEILRLTEQNTGNKNEYEWLCNLPRGAARHALASLIRNRAPDHRQLSRQFLDEVLDSMNLLRSTPHAQTWARDIPGGGRLVLDGTRIVVESTQHHQAQEDAGFEALLGPGSHALISLGDSHYELHGPLSPNVCKVYGIPAQRP